MIEISGIWCILRLVVVKRGTDNGDVFQRSRGDMPQ